MQEPPGGSASLSPPLGGKGAGRTSMYSLNTLSAVSQDLGARHSGGVRIYPPGGVRYAERLCIPAPPPVLVLVYRFFRTGITRSSAPTGPMTGDMDKEGGLSVYPRRAPSARPGSTPPFLVLVYRFFRTGITRSSAPTGPMTGDRRGGVINRDIPRLIQRYHQEGEGRGGG